MKKAADMRLIIPAAGSGIRFAGEDNPLPKLLIPIAGRPIISHHLRMASSVGDFSQIIVILGPYYEEVVQTIRELATGIKWITDTEVVCIENTKFETTNNIYSMYLARQYLEGSVIVHNSDVLIDPSLLKRLVSVENTANAWIIADNTTPIAEVETKFIVGLPNRITQFGENVPSKAAEGRYIGVTRFDSCTASIFQDEVARLVEQGDVACWYTKAMVPLARLGMLHVCWADGLPWCEIDTMDDFRKTGSTARMIANKIVGMEAGKIARVTCVR
jgi:choline kinase